MATPQNPSGARRRGFWVLAVVLAGVAVVIGVFWALQRSLIYFPDTSSVPPANEALSGGQDVYLQTSDGLALEAWFAPPNPQVEDRQLAVLVAPGNAANRYNRVGLAEALQAQGFSVVLMDYRGYSTNPGRPSQEGLIRDGRAALEAHEQQGFPPERTIYFGESLGGGVVAALLTERPPAGVVFRSPFTELADVGRHHYPWLPVRTMLRDQFPVLEPVRETQVPVSVIRARYDSVVPTELSAQVADAAPNLVAEHIVDADHNDPQMHGAAVAQAVAELADVISLHD
ncbi:MAG TPA: alpha/beta fold hydrolase [Enteractinococcus sp.]